MRYHGGISIFVFFFLRTRSSPTGQVSPAGEFLLYRTKETKNRLRAAALRTRFKTKAASASISGGSVVTVPDLDGPTIDIRYAR